MLVELDDLVERVVAGDHDAFERTYVLTIGLVASVANGILRDRRIAEDVAQEAYLRLARSSAGLRDLDGRALRAWLVSTTRNAAIDHVRRASSRREEATEAPPEQVARDETARAAVDGEPELDAALAALPIDQREALVLFHVGGLSGAEVARAIGKSRAATYTTIRRAERAMRSALDGTDLAARARPLGQQPSEPSRPSDRG